MRSCAVTSDGRTIIAGDELGRVHFLRLVEADETKPPIGDAKIQILQQKKRTVPLLRRGVFYSLLLWRCYLQKTKDGRRNVVILHHCGQSGRERPLGPLQLMSPRK